MGIKGQSRRRGHRCNGCIGTRAGYEGWPGVMHDDMLRCIMTTERCDQMHTQNNNKDIQKRANTKEQNLCGEFKILTVFGRVHRKLYKM